MEISRRNPDELLKAIQKETADKNKGRLKIFFGYAAGTGKTYAMLQAAHEAKKQGVDVVCGYIEPHERPQTAALTKGLEQIPPKTYMYNGIPLKELDLDGVLKRKPQLVLVDELAHTNAKGCRHAKRFQDVNELLKAGIDVYTTINVQHIESLNDKVAGITGVMVQERIPDSVFDQADQVKLVDIEPEELLERMAQGQIYKEAQAKQASAHFFTMENLRALREIALRRCADRVNFLTDHTYSPNKGASKGGEHILVCLSSSPSNAKIIRTAARMAWAFKGSFTALFVETPDFMEMSEPDKKRLRQNIRLAEQLGASIEAAYGQDVSYQIAEFARLSGITKIVIGRSTASRKSIFSKPTLTERLIVQAPDLDIHIIPDSQTPQKKERHRLTEKISLTDVFKSLVIILGVTLISSVFYELGFSEANIIAVYIFGVLLTAIITNSRICALTGSLISVLVFNFFFTSPRFTFQYHDPNYIVTFTIMFLIAFSTASLAAQLKKSAGLSANSAYRTKILFETNQLLQKETKEEDVAQAAAGQIAKLLHKDIVFYLANGSTLENPVVYSLLDQDPSLLTSENEKAVAQWVMWNNKHAGATTDTLSNAQCLYFAVRMEQKVYGVVGIALKNQELDAFEKSVLLSILGECALALENIHNAKEKEEAAVLAENEQLRGNLLRAISHDLRSPLTSIAGNAENLLSHADKMDPEVREHTYQDIYDDSMWLNNLVENLLAMTKIEGGQVHLKKSVQLVDEVIEEALKHISRKSKDYTIKVSSAKELILAQMDPKLIVQVIINLVDNAIKYTPQGSCIEISSELDVKKSQAVISVKDNGPGIPDEQKPYIFDMFYSGADKAVDAHRSLGLGLSLCKSIVQAHQGTIRVKNYEPKGTVFTFTLPSQEIPNYE